MTSKDNKRIVEVLNEESIDKRKAFFFKSVLVIILLLLMIVPFTVTTYSKYNSEVEAANSLRTAKWMVNVNGKSNSVSINLDNTITSNDKKVVPGSFGKIDLQIDFSGSEVSSRYTISIDDESLLPNNLKLYTDSNYNEEFDSISSSVGLDNINEIITISIYWKWNYTMDDESNWMGKDIKLKFNVDLREDTGDSNV